jgi:hypothetical protein
MWEEEMWFFCENPLGTCWAIFADFEHDQAYGKVIHG